MRTESTADFGNNILYRMCEEAPLHNDMGIIHGKIWLIGHAYSASISRTKAIQDFDGNDFIMEVIAPHIKDSDIDVWIASIQDIERLTFDNYERVLAVHLKLTELLFEVTGHFKRSLVSKYLHFHLPKSVFIYDSIANDRIRKQLRGKRFNYPKGYDNPYTQFVVRCLYYRDNFFEPNISTHNDTAKNKSTPRQLDRFLLEY